jgi:hypothetical protein
MSEAVEPRRWTLAQIEERLSQPLPSNLLSQKVLRGNKIPYISWHVATKILSTYCPGWQWEIQDCFLSQERLFLIGKLSIPTQDCGLITRSATGTEVFKETYFNRATGSQEVRDIPYGDPSSNAESMAFRRAAAKFGLGLYLYQKGGPPVVVESGSTSEPTPYQERQELMAQIKQARANHGLSVEDLKEIARASSLPLKSSNMSIPELKTFVKVLNANTGNEPKPVKPTPKKGLVLASQQTAFEDDDYA